MRFHNRMNSETGPKSSPVNEKGLKLNESWRSGATGKPCGAGLAASPAGLGSTAKLGEILAMAKGPSTKMHSATVQRAGSKSSGPSPRLAGPSRHKAGSSRAAFGCLTEGSLVRAIQPEGRSPRRRGFGSPQSCPPDFCSEAWVSLPFTAKLPVPGDGFGATSLTNP